jgi:hypothetical protein
MRVLVVFAILFALPAAAFETAQVRCTSSATSGWALGFKTPDRNHRVPFEIHGFVRETQFTHRRKFFTVATREEIRRACDNTRRSFESEEQYDRYARADLGVGEWLIIVTNDGSEYPRGSETDYLDSGAYVTTSVACYFGNPDGKYTWRWALASDKSWFSLKGHWSEMGSHMALFVTVATRDEIIEGCMRARTNSEILDDFFAAFAAQSSIDHNHQILSKDGPLFPRY